MPCSKICHINCKFQSEFSVIKNRTMCLTIVIFVLFIWTKQCLMTAQASLQGTDSMCSKNAGLMPSALKVSRERRVTPPNMHP